MWAEYVTPIGQIRFGRMPNSWGLGILTNAGISSVPKASVAAFVGTEFDPLTGQKAAELDPDDPAARYHMAAAFARQREREKMLEALALAVKNDGDFKDEAQYFVGPGKAKEEVTDIDADIIWKYDMMDELGVFPHNAATNYMTTRLDTPRICWPQPPKSQCPINK